MHFTLLLPILTATAYAAPVENLDKRAACSSYTIINTRGTGEVQGPSAGFRTMNQAIMSKVPGGEIYNTVYPAGFDQNSAAGTADIIRKVQGGLQSDPNHCFILEGYSQGAAATVNALSQLTGASFDAVKGVFLIGDPLHKPGLSCNVDNNGGTTTKNVSGLSASLPGAKSVPAEWQGKTKDVCIFVSPTYVVCSTEAIDQLLILIQGDGVCDTTHGVGINAQHLQYPMDTATQNLGQNFVVKQLTA